MEPAAGAFTGTRDSRPLQVGIKDLSSLHPVTVPNCLTRRALVMTFMLRHGALEIVGAITIITTVYANNTRSFCRRATLMLIAVMEVVFRGREGHHWSAARSSQTTDKDTHE